MRLVLVFLSCCAAAIGSGAVAAADRPNIILLLTDDQTAAATGCYGNRQVQTPQMDRLAADGVRFANHYNTTSICMASRATIMTGMYEYQTGCNFMHGPLRRSKFNESYPVLLRSGGYFTGFAGKFGFAVKDDGDSSETYHREEDLPSQAFDVWAGGPGQTDYETAKNKGIARFADEYPHSSRAYGAWAADFIRQAKHSGKPFCMSISFKAPHLPFTPDRSLDPVYAGLRYDPPANYGIDNGRHLAPHTRTGRQFNSYRFWIDSYQESIRAYNQLIHGVDVALGMIRQSLADQGLADNTVILFTSDNGYSCGAHGFGGKVLPYEEASRSPLIVYDPRDPRRGGGQVRDCVTGNIDLAPTILDLAGLPIPEPIDGVSLLPLWSDPEALSRQSIALMNMWGNDEIQELAVVTKNWKYIFWPYQSDSLSATEELFNLGSDPGEMRNLAGQKKHAAKLQEMRTLYDAHLRHLQRHAVDFHDYGKYKTLFQRPTESIQSTETP